MSTSPQNIDTYTLQELVAQNGVVEVWKAVDSRSQRIVSIKLFHPDLQTNPDFIERFEHEAQVFAALQHPNIVQTHDFRASRTPDAGEPIAYIVTDYVAGQTLADYIQSTSARKQFPSAQDIVHLFTDIGTAVDYAHQHGVTHCNIKPGSILLNRRQDQTDAIGKPMLTIFAMGNLPGNAIGNNHNSQIDTALYLAPEQTRGYAGNELSDIYSLGVILYEMCTGIPPFRGDTVAILRTQHSNTAPTSPVLLNPNISPALSDVIIRSLAKDSASRFASAVSMCRALAEAFNVPVPENLLLSDSTEYPIEPTYYRPRLSNMLPGQIPSSSSIEIIRASSPPPESLSTVSQKQSAVLADTMSSSRIPEVNSTYLPPSTTIPPGPLVPAKPKKRRKGLLIALLVMLLLLLLGSGIGSFYLRTANARQIVGYAYFVNSGKLNKDSSQGINDELELRLQNIPDPAQGKSYYAWLLGDASQGNSQPLFLGKVHISHHVVNQTYQSPHNVDLLTTTSRLLITEEDASLSSTSSSPPSNTWRYYAELSQQSDPKDTVHHYSMLNHLRSLLSTDTAMESQGLSGGLAIWLTHNTGKVLEWAGSARDNWTAKDPTNMREQIISILEYLDGVSSVQTDLPPHTQLILDSRYASIPILSLAALKQPTASYLQQISTHLQDIEHAPGITPDQMQLAHNISTWLNNVVNWLNKVHADARQLASLTNAQLLKSTTQITLDEMQMLAYYAYEGQFNSSTHVTKEGVLDIQYDIERLASFEITPYSSK